MVRWNREQSMGERRTGASKPVEERGERRRPWWRVEGRYFVHIVAGVGFAVAQPVLGSFGDSPETFVAAGASPLSIVLFGVAVVLLPALLLWALLATTGLISPRLREVSQAVVIGLVASALGLWAFADRLPARPWVVAASVALGVAAGTAYRRIEAVRMYLSFASMAPVAFLVMFLAFSPTSLLVFEPEPATAGASRSTGPPSVVIVVLDELPTASLLDDRNRIDADLFPNLAGFADDATFYRNHTAVAGQTQAVLPALLTGRYSTEEGAKRRDYEENLFALVGGSHQLNVHEAVTTLCPTALCDRRIESDAMASLGTQAWKLWSALVQGSAPGAPTAGSDPSVRSGGDDGVVDLNELMAGRDEHMDRFLASLAPERARPRLDFVHLLYPHQPWNRLPDGRAYTTEKYTLGRLAGVWTTETSAQLTRQRHLLQMQYIDGMVGEVMDRLKALGRYDSSYVVVTADHGISFAPQVHDRDIEEGNVHEVLWAPLLIKAPGQTDGVLDDSNTQVIDVMPTLADAVGIEFPWEVDGRSLLSDAPRDPADKRYLPRIYGDQPDGKGGALIPIDGVEEYRRMLAEPPASAVPGDDPLALYRMPPYTDLAGTDVRDLPHGAPIDWDVDLTNAERYGDVRPDADVVPVYVSGDVEADTSEITAGETRLVVSVNGVVGGWGAVDVGRVDDEAPTRFGVLVPPSLLRGGANSIEVWALEGPPDAPSLRPVEGGCCVG